MKKLALVIPLILAITGITAYSVWAETPIGFRRKMGRLERAIEEASHKYGLPKALILAVIKRESGGNPKAISSAGAIGLMQIMPRIGKAICGYDVKELLRPELNIDCGVRYLSQLYRKYGRLSDALAHYYAGGKAVKYRRRYGEYPKWGRPPVYAYVWGVMSSYRELRAIGV